MSESLSLNIVVSDPNHPTAQAAALSVEGGEETTGGGELEIGSEWQSETEPQRAGVQVVEVRVRKGRGGLSGVHSRRGYGEDAGGIGGEDTGVFGADESTTSATVRGNV